VGTLDDARPIMCGNPMNFVCQKNGEGAIGSSAHRNAKAKIRSAGASSPMDIGEQIIEVRPPAAPRRARTKGRRPTGPRKALMMTENEREADSIFELSSSAGRPHRPSIGNGTRSNISPIRRPRPANAKARPCVPADFERVAPHIYWFRRQRVIEIFVAHGVAMVYDYGVAGLKTAELLAEQLTSHDERNNRADSPGLSDTSSDEGFESMPTDQVLAMLGLRPRPQNSDADAVYLDDFIKMG